MISATDKKRGWPIASNLYCCRVFAINLQNSQGDQRLLEIYSSSCKILILPLWFSDNPGVICFSIVFILTKA